MNADNEEAVESIEEDRFTYIVPNILMSAFVVFSSLGTALEFGVGVGLIVLGVTSGAFGFLLGSD